MNLHEFTGFFGGECYLCQMLVGLNDGCHKGAYLKWASPSYNLDMFDFALTEGFKGMFSDIGMAQIVHGSKQYPCNIQSHISLPYHHCLVTR